MSVLEKFSPDLLSEAIKERFGLAEGEEVYLKAVRLGAIEDIKRKMREGGAYHRRNGNSSRFGLDSQRSILALDT